jgi:alpha-D-ribose 1-methylphosphonate 5-triphosphate diphosphatase
MDHTPGQRQWADLGKYRLYHRDKHWTDEEFSAVLVKYKEIQVLFAEQHRRQIVALCQQRGVTMASHDDTTTDHIRQAVQEGIRISEFPTTLEAALSAHENGLDIIMGAPNLVCGTSHSGNVTARELAEINCLDGLSSDYYPAGLLHAAFILHHNLGFTLPQAVASVTANTADMAGLSDRGEIAAGKRADLVQVSLVNNLPVVRGVWCKGRKVY